VTASPRDGVRYKVIVNNEDQYVVWPTDRQNPRGWQDTGKEGTKAECLAYVDEVWTDLRPFSLRQPSVGENDT
jgi:MbtH protein